MLPGSAAQCSNSICMPPVLLLLSVQYIVYKTGFLNVKTACRSDDMSSQEDGKAAAQESDQEADSPAQSSGSADSHNASDESGSGNESSSESEQLELEAEEEGLEVADVDLEAPRAKRRRAAVVGSHDEGCLAQPSDMPGQLTCPWSQVAIS